jgi:copper homeostasis protein CutC
MRHSQGAYKRRGSNCITGLQTIAGLLKQASGRIIILPGGGINPENVARLSNSKASAKFIFPEKPWFGVK